MSSMQKNYRSFCSPVSNSACDQVKLNSALFTLRTAYQRLKNSQTEVQKHWQTIHCECAKNVFIIKDGKPAKPEHKGLFSAC